MAGAPPLRILGPRRAASRRWETGSQRTRPWGGGVPLRRQVHDGAINPSDEGVLKVQCVPKNDEWLLVHRKTPRKVASFPKPREPGVGGQGRAGCRVYHCEAVHSGSLGAP